MARAVSFKNRFNSGELAEEAWSASDLAMNAHGCGLARNWMPRVTGPLQRRYGFWWNGETRYNDRKTRLIPFVRQVADALMLEFGDEYMRVWNADGTPLMNGGSPFQIGTPYTAAQIDGIRPHQDGDVLILCHADPSVRTRALSRRGLLLWQIDDYEFRNGPWRTENADDSVTLQISEVAGGGFDLGATVDLYNVDGDIFGVGFDAGFVGSYFRLRPSNGNPGVNTWAPLTDTLAGVPILSDGKVYDRQAGGTLKTGRTPPTHDRGTVSDGSVNWTYHDDGAAVLRCDSYIGVNAMRCTVVRAVPRLFGGATPNWAESAFSPKRGFPTAWPCVREERLAVAGGGEADKIDLSRTAGFFPLYADFTPGLGTGRVADDDAVRRYCGDSGSRVVWLLSTTMLVAGTQRGVVMVTGGTIDDPISPAATTARELYDYGVADVAPVKAHGSVLFATRGGSGLRELKVGSDVGKATRDLSFFVEHLAQKGFAELAWTADPDNLLWVRHRDGDLSLFLYHDEQQVYGWASQALGGGFKVESIASIPGPYARDALWAVAVRTKGGVQQRGVIMLSARQEGLRLDAAERYSGAPAAGVSGLTHLAGEPVVMMAGPGDGSFAQYRVTVSSSGVATLPDARTAAEIVVGLDAPSRYESLPPDLNGPGSTQGQLQRVTKMLVMLKGVSARAGVTGPEIGDPQMDVIQQRGFGEVATLRPKRMQKAIGIAGGADRDVRLVVEADGGFDCLLQALRPTELVNDGR